MALKKNQASENYLDLVPVKNPVLKWHTDLRDRVVLEKENTGAFNTIAQKLLGKPRISKIHLDAMGTFIWPLLDGQKTVEDVAKLVKERFGENAEPLYPRLITYLRNLESYNFIIMQNTHSVK